MSHIHYTVTCGAVNRPSGMLSEGCLFKSHHKRNDLPTFSHLKVGNLRALSFFVIYILVFI